MNRLLIATDGSPAADAAVQAGVQLAAEQKAGVVFLHVVDAVDVVGASIRADRRQPGRGGNPEDDEILSAAAEVARTHGVPFELKLVAGFDYETILATADEVEAELIVIGSNRHGALGTTFFGSVSKEVLERARRPFSSSIRQPRSSRQPREAEPKGAHPMKALVYHGPGQRNWEDVPDPVIIDPTDAIVRIDSRQSAGPTCTSSRATYPR